MKWLFGAAALFVTACTASEQKPAVVAVLNDDNLRHETMEATARALDDHPSYVDEFYLVARAHPQTLDRFLERAARDLHEPAFARETARIVAAHPDAIEEVMVEAVDASKSHPPDRAAIDRAVAKRYVTLADILTDDPDAVRVTMEAAVDQVKRKPRARAALLQAVRTKAPELSDIVLHDPETTRVLLGAIVKAAGEDKTALKNALQAAGL